MAETYDDFIKELRGLVDRVPSFKGRFMITRVESINLFGHLLTAEGNLPNLPLLALDINTTTKPNVVFDIGSSVKIDTAEVFNSLAHDDEYFNTFEAFNACNYATQGMYELAVQAVHNKRFGDIWRTIYSHKETGRFTYMLKDEHVKCNFEYTLENLIPIVANQQRQIQELRALVKSTYKFSWTNG